MKFLLGIVRQEGDHCSGFLGFWGICVAGNVRESFSSFEGGRVYFLRSKGSVISTVLDLLVGILHNWWWRCETRGGGFEFSRIIIIRDMETKKVRINSTGSVVGHNF